MHIGGTISSDLLVCVMVRCKPYVVMIIDILMSWFAPLAVQTITPLLYPQADCLTSVYSISSLFAIPRPLHPVYMISYWDSHLVSASVSIISQSIYQFYSIVELLTLSPIVEVCTSGEGYLKVNAPESSVGLDKSNAVD